MTTFNITGQEAVVKQLLTQNKRLKEGRDWKITEKDNKVMLEIASLDRSATILLKFALKSMGVLQHENNK